MLAQRYPPLVHQPSRLRASSHDCSVSPVVFVFAEYTSFQLALQGWQGTTDWFVAIHSAEIYSIGLKAWDFV